MVRKFLVAVVAILALLGVLLTVATRRAASVPAWYPPEPRQERPADGRGSLAEGLGDLLGIDVGGAARTGLLVQRLLEDGRVELDAGELADVVRTALSGTPDGRAFLGAAGPLGARIGDGRVEVGTLVDLPRLPAERIDADLAATMERLRSWTPFLVDGERFVGLRGVPTALDGDLGLADGASLRIGELGLPLQWVMAGSDGGPVRRRLAVDLRVLRVSRAEVQGDRLIVEAASGAGR